MLPGHDALVQRCNNKDGAIEAAGNGRGALVLPMFRRAEAELQANIDAPSPNRELKGWPEMLSPARLFARILSDGRCGMGIFSATLGAWEVRVG